MLDPKRFRLGVEVRGWGRGRWPVRSQAQYSRQEMTAAWTWGWPWSVEKWSGCVYFLKVEPPGFPSWPHVGWERKRGAEMTPASVVSATIWMDLPSTETRSRLWVVRAIFLHFLSPARSRNSEVSLESHWILGHLHPKLENLSWLRFKENVRH